MPEVQEVFQMATQKVKPDPGALERQHHDQRQHTIRRKASVFMLIGGLVLIAAGIGLSILLKDRPVATGTTPPGGIASPIPAPTGRLEPGTYAFDVATDFEADHQVTIDVPEGWHGAGSGFGVLKAGRNETSVSAWVVGDVFADACDTGSSVDPGTIETADGVAAALADQKHIRVTTPSDVTLDGYAGTYMERTLPPANADRCDVITYLVWRDTDGSSRFLTYEGQRDFLWVLDVDGSALVIDASIDADSPASDQAEVLDMVDSIRIVPF